jgi:putative heme-binding domain-containing protein
LICVFLFLAATRRIEAQDAFSACAACHGLDGKGGEHAPNIATEQRVQRMTDETILAIIRNGIPAKGMPGFRKLLNDGQMAAVLKSLRSLQGDGMAQNLAGNGDHGMKLFFGPAGCAECHMVDGRGGFLGADLSGYGGGHSAEQIRAAIVSPNANLGRHDRTVVVTTKRSTKYRGVVRNEDNFSLQMQTPDGNFHLLDKAELLSVEYEATSIMPADYGSKLSRSELDDLVKFLSGGL